MPTRRAFLLGSAAVIGGVAIGYRLREGAGDSPDLGGEVGGTALTPYVVVDRSGITIITPRAEMGQGIHTTLAALVAEELDVDFEQVQVIHGPASDDYVNRILYPARRFWRRARYRPSQATGGQTSIRDGFVRMREAGAAARLVLLEAAARRLDVPSQTLSTRQGFVVTGDGRALSYLELAEDAAGIEPPASPTLRPREAWRLLGRSLPRVDMAAKCTGTARYAIDTRLPGMLCATVVRNPYLGGRLLGVDVGDAANMRGVERVVRMEDGVIVIATNTWYAFEAARRIVFDWGRGAYPDNTEGHRARLAAAFDADPYYRPRDRGDVEAALDGATVIEGEYTAPYLAHATMEPLSAAAWLHDGELEIWAGNQLPTLARLVGAELTGLPRRAVRVHTPYMGGGFGRRFEMDDVEAAVRAALAVRGRPVKITYSRAEDMTHDAYRPMAMARFRASVADGLPEALDLALSAPSLFVSGNLRRHRIIGSRQQAVPETDVSITMGAKEQPYAIPNYRVTAYRPEELLPVGWWRSVGESQNCFFHEGVIDELAHAAGRDPLEMRLALIRHPASRRVLESVAEMSGWGSALPENHARGVAFARASGQPTALVIEISHQDGKVRLLRAWSAVDVGIALDPRNIEAQVQGALMFGLSSAIYGEITVTDGTVDQQNFDSYPLLRLQQAPAVAVQIHESGERIYGVGEAGTPTAAPALGNALFAATGRRVRDLPFRKSFRFV